MVSRPSSVTISLSKTLNAFTRAQNAATESKHLPLLRVSKGIQKYLVGNICSVTMGLKYIRGTHAKRQGHCQATLYMAKFGNYDTTFCLYDIKCQLGRHCTVLCESLCHQIPIYSPCAQRTQKRAESIVSLDNVLRSLEADSSSNLVGEKEESNKKGKLLIIAFCSRPYS